MKWRAVGIKKLYSRLPCVMVSGRDTACDRGVETPVCDPEPYIFEVVRLRLLGGCKVGDSGWSNCTAGVSSCVGVLMMITAAGSCASLSSCSCQWSCASQVRLAARQPTTVNGVGGLGWNGMEWIGLDCWTAGLLVLLLALGCDGGDSSFAVSLCLRQWLATW